MVSVTGSRVSGRLDANGARVSQPLPEIAVELTQYLLGPYLGRDETRRVTAQLFAVSWTSLDSDL
jgi:hypothetical protein